ncbi:MAG: sterol desaturase family protein [Acidimicrobiales bacterium]
MAGRLKTLLKDPTIAAIPAFLGTVAAEAYLLRGDRAARRGMQGYTAKDAAASISMGLGSLAIGAVSAAAYHRVDDKLRAHKVVNVGSGVVAWTVAIVGWDFLYYWNHRWDHEVRLLWASHVAHHSSQKYNLSTALRQEWSGWMTHLIYAPLFMVGVSNPIFVGANGVNLLYQYWIHTEMIDRMPDGFEKVFNTASHHRVHHGSNPQYLDRNYGSIFIIWDRLFGTFEPEEEPVRYGLTKNITTYNPVRIAYHEMIDIARDVRRSRTWRDRLRSIFGPPGSGPSVDSDPEPAVIAA